MIMTTPGATTPVETASPPGADATTPETPPERTEPPQAADEAAPDSSTGNAEAARYRRALRETETERDGLRGTVERLQRAEVLRLSEGQLAQPDDLFDVGGVALADLLGDDGSVDSGRVGTALAGVLQARPGLAYVPPRPTGPSAFGLGARPGVDAGKPSWQDVVRGT